MRQLEQLERVLKAFVDSEENGYYVPLNVTRINYSKLINSLNNPFKIILLFGPPGSGKSFLFQKFYDEYREKYNMALYKTPTFDFKALCKIYTDITKEEVEKDISQNEILELMREKVKEEVIIMLDESQLYSVKEMEWIRLLSNESNLKFIISVHKVEEEEVLARQHFQTRIFETIEMENLGLNDVKNYIEEKLILAEGDLFLPFFTKKIYKLVYKMTKGNLRDISRLVHRFFMLYKMQLDNYEIFNKKDTYKYMEMAALDLGMLKKKSWFSQWI